MKKIVMLNSIKQLKELLNYIDGVIVGVKDLCINNPYDFSMNEIKEIIDICNNHSKEVFISLNKNIHNNELEELKEVLIKLNKFNITGLLYYDIAIPNLKKSLNLKYDLVWSQEHLTTNYMTSDFWYTYGAKYVFLSNEITLEEINEIKQKTKAKTMMTVFGYLPMFVSRRHLVKNYLETFDIEDNSNINYIEKEGRIYPIIDSKNATIAYSSSIMNGISELFNIKADYIVLNSFNIDDDLFKKTVIMFNNVNKKNINEYNERINSFFKTDKGFLYKETIYKVK